MLLRLRHDVSASLKKRWPAVLICPRPTAYVNKGSGLSAEVSAATMAPARSDAMSEAVLGLDKFVSNRSHELSITSPLCITTLLDFCCLPRHLPLPSLLRSTRSTCESSSAGCSLWHRGDSFPALPVNITSDDRQQQLNFKHENGPGA